ncbi:MAG TPA: tetratricopeptide repeat protein [Vicinamibacteria bacterium]|nr:tetratricopeptide repeat protein [Vicinamibacteria bacterium]
MKVAWARPRLEPSDSPGFETIAAPRVESDRPWILFVGNEAEALAAAASHEIGTRENGSVLAPPETPPLPVAVHRLKPPDLSGERTLFAPRLERAFWEGPFCAGSALYLLAKLTELAAEGEPLRFVATAIEASAKELVAQRGLASRFEIRRVPGGVDSTPQTSCRDACEAALADEPGSGLSLLFRASNLSPGRALTALKEAITIEPELAAAHYELGKRLVQADDLEGAVAAFRRTTELLPSFPSAWGNLGAALGELKRLDEAAEALQCGIALDPLNHALHSNLGATYRDQGRMDHAEARFREALRLAPDFVFGHYNLAGVLFLTGRYDEAIVTFETARALDPSRSLRQSLLLAAARLGSGDFAGALREYGETLGRATGAMKADLSAVAEWDLEQLSRRVGGSASIEEALRLVRSMA